MLLARPELAAGLAAAAGRDAVDSRDLAVVADIRAALARLEAGLFGLCVRCGSRITENRLTLRPVTTCCAGCDAQAGRRQ